MSENLLGKTVLLPEKRAPEILFAIPRSLSRKTLGLEDSSLPFEGFDDWNCYEFSWLDNKGKPNRRFLRLLFPCSSPFLVESKSLKLYLSSYLQERFSSEEQVVSLIENDLTKLLKTEVKATFSSPPAPLEVSGKCLDHLEISIDAYTPNPSLLATEDNSAEELLYTDLFKSNCPVTGQPDYATVAIAYKGKKISKEGLLTYLISYRNHQEYHECCVERIFIDLQKRCSPEKLSVAARFTRRGGIDINPYRHTANTSPLSIERVLFQ